MSWATLGGVTLDNPNGFREANEMLGADTVTLSGKVRRSVRAVKRVWIINYTYMSAADYDNLYNLYELGNPVVFTVVDSSKVYIQDRSVFVDIDARSFVAGNPNYLANVAITLREEG